MSKNRFLLNPKVYIYLWTSNKERTFNIFVRLFQIISLTAGAIVAWLAGWILSADKCSFMEQLKLLSYRKSSKGAAQCNAICTRTKSWAQIVFNNNSHCREIRSSETSNYNLSRCCVKISPKRVDIVATGDALCLGILVTGRENVKVGSHHLGLKSVKSCSVAWFYTF